MRVQNYWPDLKIIKMHKFASWKELTFDLINMIFGVTSALKMSDETCVNPYLLADTLVSIETKNKMLKTIISIIILSFIC